MHTIFLIHGMGKYGAVGDDGVYTPDTKGWFEQAETALKRGYDNYVKADIGGGAEFGTRFKVVPISYDSYFETYRQSWAKQANDWTAIQAGWADMGLPGEWLGGLQKFLSGGAKDDFAWTHAADVVLYSMDLIRLAVAPKVALQIVDRLHENPGPWSIVAHSLGTAVLHDTYGRLSFHLKERGMALTKPTLVCSLANVAWALSRNSVDAYSNALAPGASGFKPLAYMNCNHELDLIAKLDPFNPTKGDWVGPEASGRYIDLSSLSEYYPSDSLLDWKGTSVTGLVEAILPHGFAHYIEQPEVAGYLWPLLMDRSPVDHFSTIHDAVDKANKKKRKEAIKSALTKRLDHLLDQAGGNDKMIAEVLPVIRAFLGGK